MEELVEEYTGLLWSVAARRLREPEDVKDCVNETFLEFYAHRQRFDPDKGSLKGYLSVITDRLALKRYRELCRYEAGEAEEQPDRRDAMAGAESRADLEAALAQLEPLDAEIIRRKYYGGMGFKEIAASLGIPYETVKKRHQRSLKKMQKSLVIGLVLALLAALLAACAYIVLRYFGVVPGYGVNTNAETGVYILEETAALETEDYSFTITDAWWNDGLLVMEYSIELRNDKNEESANFQKTFGLSSFSLEGLDEAVSLGSSTSRVNSRLEENEWYVRFALPEGAADRLELRLLGTPVPLTLTLRRAEEVGFEQAGFYDLTEDQGGLLAIPRLENGELILSIYPLNQGDFSIDAGLTRLCGETAPVTVTAADGTVLTGTPVGWHPFGSETYFDWNFGPAEPGEYTLRVPYVYEMLAQYDTGAGLLIRRDSQVRFSLNLLDMEETTVTFPYGSLTLTEPEAIAPVDLYPDRVNPVMVAFGEVYDHFSWWMLGAEWSCTAPERELANATITAEGYMLPGIEKTVDGATITIDPFYMQLQPREDGHALGDLLVGCYEGSGQIFAYINEENICYCWNHEFVIPFAVNETE
ncbi:MAG: RNA polymerase sigma factor [Oscillospiraceae bacterium]